MESYKKLITVLLSSMMMLSMAGCAKETEGLAGVAHLPETQLHETFKRYAHLNYDQKLVRTLKNGDTFYTPGITHSVKDDEHAISYYNNLLLVFTKQDLPQIRQYELESLVNGRIVGEVKGAIHALQILVEDTSLNQLYEKAELLMDEEDVLYVSSDYPVQIMSEEDENPWHDEYVQNDRGNEYYPSGNDWWAEAIGAYTAWEYSEEFEDINIGIIDDGFYTQHEDLKGQITLVNEYSTNDLTGHGTHVAGIVGALNNDKGIRGIASHAKLYCADLWPEESTDSYHTMLEFLASVNYMVSNDVKVINNSWGVYTPKINDFKLSNQHRMEEDLIPTAEACIMMLAQLIDSGHEDLILVQAAGNSAIDARNSGFFARIDENLYQSMDKKVLKTLEKMQITYEDIDSHILIVGSVENKTDRYGDYYLSTFSNYGDTVDICAPGTNIYSTVSSKLGYYDHYSGTSMAAPMVTASVGVLWSIDPELTVTEIRELLFETNDIVAFYDEGIETYVYPMLNIGEAAEYLIDEYSWMDDWDEE